MTVGFALRLAAHAVVSSSNDYCVAVRVPNNVCEGKEQPKGNKCVDSNSPCDKPDEHVISTLIDDHLHLQPHPFAW